MYPGQTPAALGPDLDYTSQTFFLPLSELWPSPGKTDRLSVTVRQARPRGLGHQEARATAPNTLQDPIRSIGNLSVRPGRLQITLTTFKKNKTKNLELQTGNANNRRK